MRIKAAGGLRGTSAGGAAGLQIGFNHLHHRLQIRFALRLVWLFHHMVGEMSPG